MKAKKLMLILLAIAIVISVGICTVVYINNKPNDTSISNVSMEKRDKTEKHIKSDKINKKNSYTAEELSKIKDVLGKREFKPTKPICTYHRHGGIKSF